MSKPLVHTLSTLLGMIIRRIRPRILFIALSILLLAGYGGYAICEHIRMISTSGRLALSIYAISKTFSASRWNAGEYEPVRAIFQEFPRLKKQHNRLIDGWGNDIRVIIKENADAFVITVDSAGKDRKFETDDDHRRTLTFSKESR